MRRLSPELLEATRHIDVAWDDEREARVLAGLGRRRRARTRRRLALVGGTAALLIGLGLRALVPSKGPIAAVVSPIRVTERSASDDALSIGERSRAIADRDAVFEHGSLPLLRRGHARFLVDEARPLRIAAGTVILEARAARFGVSVDRERVAIKVDEGRVVVLEGERRTELGVGDATFPAQAVLPAASNTSPAPVGPASPSASMSAERSGAPRATVAAPAVEEPAPLAPRRPSWRELAADGDYDRAHAALANDPRPPADVTQLLLAADVARLSHHPAEALAPLHRILDEHAADPRAQLAAFTLGRVLLDELGRPSEAAAAFVRAEALAPGGPLSEDAVAREIEAWSRAGETTRARARAEDYLRRFPDGRRARSVRRFGGLE
jgi:transmembrane sensor